MYCDNPECPDYLESGIRGEYVDGVTVCPICGAYLVDVVPEGEAAGSLHGTTSSHDHDRDAREFEEVASTSDPSEMMIIRSILDGAEIRFMIEGQERFSALRANGDPLRFNPLAGEVVFLVAAEDAETARALLTEVDSNPLDERAADDGDQPDHR